MKKLFLILLLLPIGLLADDWIFTVENTTMVKAYFNIFNAIKALFQNDNYIDLLRLAFLVGGFFVFAKGVLAAWEGSASANMLSPYGKYLAVGVALLTLIFSKTSTLWVEAKELPTYCPGAPTGAPATTAFAVELPSVLAYVFKVTNTIGTELTYIAEAAFSIPSNPAGSAAMSDSDGYLGSLKATIGLLNINPSYVTLSKRDATMADKATDFVQDFRMFYQSCITQNNQNQGSEGREQDYKIMNSKDIMKTIDLYIGSDSPNTGFKFSSGKYPGNAYTNIYGVPKTCRAVWADLKSTEGAIAKFASKMCSVYPKINGGVFELITGTHGAGNAMEITDIGLQAGLINAIRSSNKYDSIGIQGGGSFTAGESRAVTNLEQLSTASYMAEMIPYLQMTMRAVLYAFFPFVFVVVLLPGGLAVLTQYLQTMIWIELWTPTAAIVNMFINLRVKETVGGEYSKEGLTLMTSVDMLSEANTIAGVGAVLYLSIPPLTWLILKGSGQMLGGMLSSHSSGFTKHLDANRDSRNNDLKQMETMKTINNERAANKEKALSWAEVQEYEARQIGAQIGGEKLASMNSGLQAEKSAAYQKTGEALETALGNEKALGGNKNVVQSKATSNTVAAKNQQQINKDLGYGDDKGSDFARIEELSKYQAAQELAKTESGQKFLKEMGVLDNKNDINKDAINNMTDTQAADMRNNLFDSIAKQKVLGIGIGKDGGAQAKKNANTKAHEEKVQLGTNEIVQSLFSDEDRATQEAISKAFSISTTKEQFRSNLGEAFRQGGVAGASNRYKNREDEVYQKIIDEKTHANTMGQGRANTTNIEKNVQDGIGNEAIVDGKSYNEKVSILTGVYNERQMTAEQKASTDSASATEKYREFKSQNEVYENEYLGKFNRQIDDELKGFKASLEYGAYSDKSEEEKREAYTAAALVAAGNLAEKGLYSKDLAMSVMSNPKAREYLQQIGALQVTDKGTFIADSADKMQELRESKGSDSVEYQQALRNIKGALDGTKIKNSMGVNGTSMSVQTNVVNGKSAVGYDFGYTLTGVDALSYTLNDTNSDMLFAAGVGKNGYDQVKSVVSFLGIGKNKNKNKNKNKSESKNNTNSGSSSNSNSSSSNGGYTRPNGANGYPKEDGLVMLENNTGLIEYNSAD